MRFLKYINLFNTPSISATIKFAVLELISARIGFSPYAFNTSFMVALYPKILLKDALSVLAPTIAALYI
nr:MAG TPA: hypothetical protein [Bacteriophage sp.]